jgi:hypothetical protein
MEIINDFEQKSRDCRDYRHWLVVASAKESSEWGKARIAQLGEKQTIKTQFSLQQHPTPRTRFHLSGGFISAIAPRIPFGIEQIGWQS